MNKRFFLSNFFLIYLFISIKDFVLYFHEAFKRKRSSLQLTRNLIDTQVIKYPLKKVFIEFTNIFKTNKTLAKTKLFYLLKDLISRMGAICHISYNVFRLSDHAKLVQIIFTLWIYACKCLLFCFCINLYFRHIRKNFFHTHFDMRNFDYLILT